MTAPIVTSPVQHSDILPPGARQALLVVAASAPPITQNMQVNGTFWLSELPLGNGNLYVLAGFVNGAPQWNLIAGGSGSIVDVDGTTNQVNVSNVGGVATVSLPTALVAPGSVTATTSLTATLGNITATNGNLVLTAAGNKVVHTSMGTTSAAGANSAGTVALVAGTVVVSTTAVTANSQIHLTCQALGTVTAPSALAVTAKSAGTSFTILASQNTDTSTIFWEIVN